MYAHADLHGAPSTILKDGQKAPDSDLREACNFALAQSKGWVAALTDGSAYWVYPDQVSKTPEAGEFVPRGAFIIRGKSVIEEAAKTGYIKEEDKAVLAEWRKSPETWKQ